jgi:hypothetical protein
MSGLRVTTARPPLLRRDTESDFGLVPLQLGVKLPDALPMPFRPSLYDFSRVDELDWFAAFTTRPTSVSSAFSSTSLASVSRNCCSR